MPTQLRTAPPRAVTQRIAAARAIQLNELYARYDEAGVKLMDLEILELRAVRNAAVGCGGGRAVTATSLSEGDEVVERLTILTSAARPDRVAAALYSVRVNDVLTKFPVRPGSGLGRLASHVAAEVA